MSSKRSTKSTFWQQHVLKYKASGQSRPVYCRRHGLKLHQLAYYVCIYNKKLASQEGGFARVVVAEPAGPASHARLMISGGMSLEFDSGADPAWVARLIAAVGGRP